MREHDRGVSALHIGFVYVGTVVGAGFATGQELTRFFTHYGLRGVWGLLASTALFVFYGIAVMELGRRLKADSHLPVLEAVGGRWLSRSVDGVITFFLFGALAVMIAGSGAIFAEEFHLPRVLGTLLMAAAAGLTVMAGMRGVIAAISAVAPVLVAAVLAISAVSLVRDPPVAADLAWYRPDLGAARFWPVAALLYVSYNLVLATAVLAPLGVEAADRAALERGGIFGGLALGLSALAIHLALMAGLPETAAFEVPMLHLARRLGPVVALLYTGVLWAEVYTTAAGSLYGLAARLVGPRSPAFRRVALAATAGGLLLGQAGFSRMVGILFPLVGWAGLLLLGALTAGWVRGRRLRPAAAAGLQRPDGYGVLHPAPVPGPVPGPDELAAAPGAPPHANEKPER